MVTVLASSVDGSIKFIKVIYLYRLYKSINIIKYLDKVSTGEREIQDDHREAHKYGESLGKKQIEVFIGKGFVMLLDSLFLSFGIESFKYAQNICDLTLLFFRFNVFLP